MTDHLEIETKLELAPEEFSFLLEYGTIQNKEEQLNIYFDYAWLLARSSGTFRVRMTKAGCSALTLKVPVGGTGRARSMREFEILLGPTDPSTRFLRHKRTIDVEHELPVEWRVRLVDLGIHELHRQGWVRNTRYHVSFEDLGCVELDHLRLPNGQSLFEAEIESTDLWVHERLRALIERLAPSARPSSMSKFQRFVEAVRSLPQKMLRED